jgi:hypothetical protein
VANPLTADGAVDRDVILRRLAAGPGGPVLVADIPAFSSAPPLSQLLASRTEGRPLYQVDPLAALSADRPYVSVAELAAETAGAFARSEPAGGPAIVIGYCSAAALSLHVATLLARSRAATAVLVRPTWPDTAAIEDAFSGLAANVGARQLPCPDLDSGPEQSVRRMEELLGSKIAALASSQGLDPSTDTFGELLLSYRSWLAFLLACRNDPRAGWAAGTIAVTVLTEAADSVTVPGLAPGQFTVSSLAALDEDNPITPELVGLLVAQITG